MQLIKVFCIAMAFFLLSGCSTNQLYYVKDANMIYFSESNKKAFNRNRPEPARLLLNGHYVQSGEDLVLLIRKFDKGNIFTVDDETYEKLTIEIKSYTLGEPIQLNSPDIRFYYSIGSSGFVFKGHGVYSVSGSGSVVVKKIGKNTILVGLDLVIWTEPAGAFPFKGRKVQMQGSFSFKEKQLSDLSPWLGVPDPSLGKEVYP